MSVESKYDTIIDSLIDTINKKGAEIDELKAKIDELKAENNKLKSKKDKFKLKYNKLKNKIFKAEKKKNKKKETLRRLNESKVDNNDSQQLLEPENYVESDSNIDLITSYGERKEERFDGPPSCNTTPIAVRVENSRKKIIELFKNKKNSTIERSYCVLNELNILFKVKNINFIISDDPVPDVPCITDRLITEISSSWHTKKTFRAALEKYKVVLRRYIREIN